MDFFRFRAAPAQLARLSTEHLIIIVRTLVECRQLYKTDNSRNSPEQCVYTTFPVIRQHYYFRTKH